MAKAIYGHIGADAALAAEVVRLRARVRELEKELSALADATAPVVAEWEPGDWLIPDDLLVPDPL